MRSAGLLVLLSLGGCAHGGQTEVFDRGPITQGGWHDAVVKAADEAFIYAQMANNAYAGSDTRPRFSLPPAYKQRHEWERASDSFAYALFDKYDAQNRIVETIIAYRGTDKPKDWLTGNFTRRQNRVGLELYDIVRRQLDEVGYGGVPITVTGHSLGGGISGAVSYERNAQGVPPIRAYTFNASPNFAVRAGVTPPRRLSFAEYGEFLKITRSFKGEGKQDYLSINCHKGFRPIADHSIRQLADCLTWIAGYKAPPGDMSLADKSLAVNPVFPPNTQPADSPPPTTVLAGRRDPADDATATPRDENWSQTP